MQVESVSLHSLTDSSVPAGQLTSRLISQTSYQVRKDSWQVGSQMENDEIWSVLLFPLQVRNHTSQSAYESVSVLSTLCSVDGLRSINSFAQSGWLRGFSICLSLTQTAPLKQAVSAGNSRLSAPPAACGAHVNHVGHAHTHTCWHTRIWNTQVHVMYKSSRGKHKYCIHTHIHTRCRWITTGLYTHTHILYCTVRSNTHETRSGVGCDSELFKNH